MKKQSKTTVIEIYGTPTPDLKFLKWKFKVFLEKAKRLSVNLRFRGSISKLRDKWQIETWSGSKENSPSIILYECTRHLSASDRDLLDSEMDELADTFYLDREFEYGLIILALCFGLTPELIINRWKDICLVATAATEYQHYIIEDLPQDYDSLEKDYLEAISFLVHQLNHPDGKVEIPHYIELMLQEASDKVQDKSDLDLNWGMSKKKGINDHTLLVNIGPYTRLDHISIMWPLIEEKQSKLWDVPKQDYRIWRNYERDVFIWQKVRVEHMTYEKAYYDHWLVEHPDEAPVNISVIKKAVRKIDKINE